MAGGLEAQVSAFGARQRAARVGVSPHWRLALLSPRGNRFKALYTMSPFVNESLCFNCMSSGLA